VPHLGAGTAKFKLQAERAQEISNHNLVDTTECMCCLGGFSFLCPICDARSDDEDAHESENLITSVSPHLVDMVDFKRSTGRVTFADAREPSEGTVSATVDN